MESKELACLLCESNNTAPFKKYAEIGEGAHLVKVHECKSCGHIFSVVSETQTDLYTEGKYALLDTRNSFSDKIKNFDSKRIINQLRKKLPKANRLLDFGCGKGIFLSGLGQEWDAIGIETSKERAEFGIEQYDVQIITQFYESGPIAEEPFDVITSFHVLEHIPEPISLYRELVESNLASAGVLVMEVPLLNSWQSKIAGKDWIQLDPPLHLSHFTNKTLRQFIEALNMKIVRKSTFSLQLGVLGMVQSLMSRLGFKGDLIERLKFKRTFGFMLLLAAILPFATILEFVAVLFGRGGVIRVYAMKE